MRLVYITSMLPYGDKEAFFIPEIMEWKRRHHDVMVVPMYPRGPIVHEDAMDFLDCVKPTSPLSGEVIRGAGAEFVCAPRRCAAAASGVRLSRNIRILMKNTSIVPKGLWLGRLARHWRADHIHAQWASTSSTMAYVASRVAGLPWSFTAHRWDIAENNIAEEKARTAGFVRVIDENGAAELRQRVGRHGSKIRVIHMGVPQRLTEPTNHRHLDRALGLRIVIAANLVSKKGHVFALEAAALLKKRGVPFDLEIVGDGPLRASMETRARELGLVESVRFRGVMGHGELLSALQAGRWNVALLPSIVTENGEKEGIPVFLIEAMACGVPVVSTFTGGIPELVAGAGLLVSARSGIAIAEALVTLWEHPEVGSAMSAKGIARVRAEFTVEQAIDRLEAEVDAATPSR